MEQERLQQEAELDLKVNEEEVRLKRRDPVQVFCSRFDVLLNQIVNIQYIINTEQIMLQNAASIIF